MAVSLGWGVDEEVEEVLDFWKAGFQFLENL